MSSSVFVGWGSRMLGVFAAADAAAMEIAAATMPSAGQPDVGPAGTASSPPANSVYLHSQRHQRQLF